MLIFFAVIKTTTGYTGLGYLLAAHTAFCIPFAYLPIRARLENMDLALERAAADLYATPFKTFWRITLPLLWPGILAGGMLAGNGSAGGQGRLGPEQHRPVRGSGGEGHPRRPGGRVRVRPRRPRPAGRSPAGRRGWRGPPGAPASASGRRRPQMPFIPSLSSLRLDPRLPEVSAR